MKHPNNHEVTLNQMKSYIKNAKVKGYDNNPAFTVHTVEMLVKEIERLKEEVLVIHYETIKAVENRYKLVIISTMDGFLDVEDIDKYIEDNQKAINRIEEIEKRAKGE